MFARVGTQSAAWWHCLVVRLFRNLDGKIDRRGFWILDCKKTNNQKRRENKGVVCSQGRCRTKAKVRTISMLRTVWAAHEAAVPVPLQKTLETNNFADFCSLLCVISVLRQFYSVHSCDSV